MNLKASIGINQPIGFPEYLGSADYATLYNEARLNDAKMTGADISSLNLFSQQAIDNFRRAKGDNSDGLGYDWDYYDFAFKPGLEVRTRYVIMYWPITFHKAVTTNIRMPVNMTRKPSSPVTTSVRTSISTLIVI